MAITQPPSPHTEQQVLETAALLAGTGIHPVVEQMLQEYAKLLASPAIKPKTGFMCMTDWQHHLGEDCNGTPVYSGEQELRDQRLCVTECGIVEVEVTLKQVVAHCDYNKVKGQ